MLLAPIPWAKRVWAQPFLTVLATARNFGMLLGIGLAGAILTTHLAQNSADALYRGVDVGCLAAAGVAALGVGMSALKKER